MKKCTKCGIEKPLDDFFARKSATDGRMSWCKKCKIAAIYKWREKNADKWREYIRNEIKRPHRAEKRKKYIQSARAIELNRAVERNPKTRATRKAWRKANPDKCNMYAQQKRARRLKACGESKITSKEWRECKERFRNRCYYCGKNKKLTLDHIKPLSRGGKHELSNIVPACKECNNSKWARDDVQFAQYLGRLL